MSDLARNIAVYLYEQQGEIWSHIEDFRGIAKPRNYQPASKSSSLANPFLRKYRSAVLTDEAARLYNALAFAMYQHGIVMNGHMTVVWELLGVRDHIKAASVLTEFNARTRKWLEVDGSGRRRKGTRSTVWGPGEPFYYAYVHEHASSYGFHTHELFHVSDGKARAFAERAVASLAQLTGVTKPPAEAVVIVVMLCQSLERAARWSPRTMMAARRQCPKTDSGSRISSRSIPPEGSPRPVRSASKIGARRPVRVCTVFGVKEL